ncbi:putative thump domain containing protein [Eutypa lata UCREL1]|uniref:Putative thump domain containing protein n=1 Tax=Eutypa lata (strain UCR-EL1) TaxID=1287681 RepID=M7SVY9_EUTLA|nr:putative thump domain containing protein [Eutypa lata UCREL1]
MESSKRKQPPTGGPSGPSVKKRQGGSEGRWQTPYQKVKLEAHKGKYIEVGDVGIWVTCIRGKERQAAAEFTDICNEYGEKLYGIKPPEEDDPASDEEDGGDIESSIKKELDGMKSSEKPKKDLTFEPVRKLGIDCLFFMRTKQPVDPRQLVEAICQDAKNCTDRKQRRTRFINRLTPVALIGKATENGVEEVAKKVLAEHFQLTGTEEEEEAEVPPTQQQQQELEASSYAIRPTIRAHSTLKRDDVIKKVASLIAPRHKVNLSAPDKVVLIDIFQTFCGMSVVGSDWDTMKRFNIYELYEAALKRPSNPSAEPKA